MAKKKEPTPEKKDELLTLGKKTKPEEVKKESVFGNMAKIEQTIRVTSKEPIKDLNGIEEKIITSDVPVVAKEIVPVVPETIVYELTFMKDSIEQIVYTRDLPIINEKFLLNITNAFGRSNLREVVLGKREIKISCNSPLIATDLTIDMRAGLLIKVVSEADWMNREYADTKKIFDEAVLKAYREMAAQGITAQTPNPNQNLVQGKKRPINPKRNPELEDEDFGDYPVGNIPVGGRPLLDF